MTEFDPYLKQIREGKLKELRKNEKKEFDFKLLQERTGLSIEDAYDLVEFASKSNDKYLIGKLLSYAKVN